MIGWAASRAPSFRRMPYVARPLDNERRPDASTLSSGEGNDQRPRALASWSLFIEDRPSMPFFFAS